MPYLSLQTAVADYGHTRPLIDGLVTSAKLGITHVPVNPITTAFRRMVRGLEYDLSEMALSTYLCALAHNKPITALPIFVLRRFEHDGIVYNVNSGIRSPADLEGRKVGVRSYTYTPGVWARGILSSSFSVDCGKITWVLFGDEHVAEYQAPANVVSAPKESDLVAALESGEIDAAIGLRNLDSPNIQPLIPHPQEAAKDFFTQTGIYPISHTMVVKNQLLESHPWLAEEIYGLFQEAKSNYLAHLNNSQNLDSADRAMQNLKAVVGEDPIPYGLEANQKTLEAFIKFNAEQQIIPRQLSLEEIFPAQAG